MRTNFQALRIDLCDVTSWMHLAQGFVGNVPYQVAMTESIFTNVLGRTNTEDGYGRFVPEILKPHNYNFRYGE
jgi:hypothetical protein